MGEKFNFNVEKTETGVQVNIEPKDKTKKEAFQKMFDACRDFCESGNKDEKS